MPLDEATVRQYHDQWLNLAEQQGSRLRQHAGIVKTGVVGESVSFDRMGVAESHDLPSPTADTVNDAVDNSRRIAFLAGKVSAPLVGEFEQVKTLLDLKNPYNMKARNKLGRDIDLTIINALCGTAFEGKNGATPVPLPAAQKIAVGGTGFTIAKWRQAKKILDDAEVEDEGRVLVIDSKALNTDLLADTTLTSSDFNTVKALVNGDVNHFLGFDVVRTQLLLKDPTNWRAIAFQKLGLGYAVGKEIETDIGQRRDKNMAWQIYTRMFIGAVRTEDARVVEISYTP